LGDILELYEEDPEAAEEDALEEELAWKLNLLMTNQQRATVCVDSLRSVSHPQYYGADRDGSRN